MQQYLSLCQSLLLTIFDTPELVLFAPLLVPKAGICSIYTAKQKKKEKRKKNAFSTGRKPRGNFAVLWLSATRKASPFTTIGTACTRCSPRFLR